MPVAPGQLTSPAKKFTDLEPGLGAIVEQLIDFVAEAG